ncbi:hypothetical protein AB9T89_10280 [Flavobacterium oncorhynchi]|uniref:hypothetical protein n=1 Tax=Flavobacterium oncorhynchi TaxID=728056 RepID=UPI00351A9E5C
MINKGSISFEEKNSAFTPKAVNEALASLPTNFVVKAKKLLDEWFEKEETKQTYSKVYISRVKNGSAFNEEIMRALVLVGQSHKEILNTYGVKKKKTSQTN